MTENDIMPEVRLGIKELTSSLTHKFNLDFGVAEIVVFENILVTLNSIAPMEFKEYIDALVAEEVNEASLNPDMNVFRDQLVDTLKLVCSG